MENKAMREKHERLLERCRETPLVRQAIEGFFCTFCELVAPLIQSMAEKEEADERDKG